MSQFVSNNVALAQQLASVTQLWDHALAENRGKPVANLETASDIILKYWKAAGCGRIIVGVGGFPASGKTYSAKRITRDLNAAGHGTLAVHVPMDGFHLPHRQLIADGMDNIKGDITTYDARAFVNLLSQYKNVAGSSLLAPDYVREKHDVVENSIQVRPETRVLVTEGIYVGYSTGLWGEVRTLLDILFYLDESPEQCADRIVARNLAVSRSAAMIENKLNNDFVFMKRSVEIVQYADYVLRPKEVLPTTAKTLSSE